MTGGRVFIDVDGDQLFVKAHDEGVLIVLPRPDEQICLAFTKRELRLLVECLAAAAA